MSQATSQYMSHWTAEGSPRSNRNAGKTPSFEEFPPSTTMEENHPKNLLDNHDADGISFATDDLTTDTDNIAIVSRSIIIFRNKN